MATIPLNQSAARTRPHVPVRLVLVGAAAALVLLTLIAIQAAYNAYAATLSEFRSIAETSSAKVSASEKALAYVAAIDSSAADAVATAPDNPKHWQSLDAVHSNFQSFRDQMFAVRANLSDDPNSDEQQAFRRVEYFSFDQFWQHLGNMLTAEQNGDRATAVQEYIIADNYLQNQIARYLLQLESLNYNAMVKSSADASAAIGTRTFLLGLLVVLLAIGVTVLSFWLRQQVRRILTPGIDLAMVLGWLLAILMLTELAQSPGQLTTMVGSSYQTVSAASRVLAVAGQANSMQSGSVIDPTNADYWNQNFETYRNSVELRLCGVAGCLGRSFGTFSPDPTVVAAAEGVSQQTLDAIGGVQPLTAGVDFPGELEALESARIAFQDYVKINASVRNLVKANQIDDATDLSTGDATGQSAEAFARFSAAMAKERDINVQVFNDTWDSVRTNLSRNQILLSLLGYVVLIVVLAVGTYHRFREL